MLNLSLFAANGRMGRALVEAVAEDGSVSLDCAYVRQGSTLAGLDSGNYSGIGNNEVLYREFKPELAISADVAIDFSLAEGMLVHLQQCVEQGIPVVIGTTGLSESQLEQIDLAARHIPIVFAANYSVGVNLSLQLLKMASQVMGEYTDIEILEAHHRHKRDAPSGTALAMGQVIAETLGRDLNKDGVFTRYGDTGERDRTSIGFATLRAGDIVGEHRVMFADIGETLEISHKATSRLTFAKGAVRAALWLKGKDAGLYSMQNVLGLD